MTRLNRDDWTEATLSAIAAKGLSGVNIEQIATALTATKGSFYHHFEDRDALIIAALAWWERDTESLMQRLRAISDPLDRLEAATLDAVGDGHGFLDVALIAEIDNPVVGSAVRRVNELRLDFLSDTIEQLGIDSSVSRLRAAESLGAYIGLFTLQRVMDESYSFDAMAAHMRKASERMYRP